MHTIRAITRLAQNARRTPRLYIGIAIWKLRSIQKKFLQYFIIIKFVNFTS